jgi:hypothetical protein
MMRSRLPVTNLANFLETVSGQLPSCRPTGENRKTGTSKVNRDEGSNRLDYFRVADHPRRSMKFPNSDGLIKVDPHGGAFDGSNTPGITLTTDWAKRTDLRRLVSENTILGHLLRSEASSRY